MSILTRLLIVIVAVAVALSASNHAGSAHNLSAAEVDLTVHTTQGTLRGTSTGATDEFLGVPYAAPPIGDLRWQPPAPAASWPGVREATEFAPHCAQPASVFGTASTSEDCLYLNVFAPADRSRPLPVMVWLHGGAFVYGESDDFDPSDLVSHGVIVVTVNYRLGALGFLADPALGRTSGNYGLEDQQAALRWVRSNIDGFGGDAHNVTLFGESAGGLSVLAQLASPGARGLFTRAISESGTYNMVTNSLSTAEAAGTAFAAKAGCTDPSASCLRALPVATILADENLAGYRPDVDGTVLTETLQGAFAGGDFARVPVILGTNRDEYRVLLAQEQSEGVIPRVNADNYTALISGVLGVPPAAATAIAAQYPLSSYDDPNLAFAAILTDTLFACPALATDTSLSRYVPTYAYEFADENAPERYLPSMGYPYGATHTAELPYLFRLTAPIPGILDADQQRLSADMMAYWTTFAKVGAPRAARWPSFIASTPVMLSLDTPKPTQQSSFAAEHQCGFWAPAS